MPLKPMYPANNPVTVQLAQDLLSTDCVIAVTHVSLFPTPPNFVTVGTDSNAETILYTGMDLEEGHLTGCQRGRLGTTAADWPAGEFIYHAWSANNANILMENILILGEEKASTQELLRVDEALETLESNIQTLNTGKANQGAVEELSQSLDSLSQRLDEVELQKADTSHIYRIDTAIAALEHAIAGLGGEGELDPSDIARLEAAIVAVNQALAAKADASHITRIDEDLTALSTALEGKASAADLAAKADATHITRIDEDLTALSTALEGKASADDLAAKADATHITRIDEELEALSTALEGKASADDLAAKADATHITRIDEELEALSTALEGKASAAQVEALTHRIYSVSLTAQGWIQDEDGFRHPLSLAVADGEQADFSAPMPVLHQLAQGGILVHFENHHGVLSAVASGQPDFDFIAQATIYKVVSGA
ncbi:MAG: hypothetical protein ACOX0K_00915 [Oscillospiraceae bacterium]|jgi:hypothetical protein